MVPSKVQTTPNNKSNIAKKNIENPIPTTSKAISSLMATPTENIARKSTQKKLGFGFSVRVFHFLCIRVRFLVWIANKSIANFEKAN
jgi:hypothetical protein